MRCYNGCPDTQLQSLLDAQSAAHQELKSKGLHATYYPVEQKWLVFRGVKCDWVWHNTVLDAARFYRLERNA
jgi:hypothetical protein